MPELWTDSAAPRRERRPLPGATRALRLVAVTGLLTAIAGAVVESRDSSSSGCDRTISATAAAAGVLWITAAAILAAAFVAGLVLYERQGPRRGAASIIVLALLGIPIEWLTLAESFRFCF